ncbi:NACHT and WD40 repeat domain-containing protein [Hyalangium versicolor]|uniref:NACHT and WD40 repeat domain-containing protein n=1 Tax=Hyalangium versicolor TaxID=2861190 RepID=UPI001CCBD3CA|nr:pentapeptide repeat-containing protein [Hyalangium versicolor]
MRSAKAIADDLPVPEPVPHFQRVPGRPIVLKDLERLGTQKSAPASRAKTADALRVLISWAAHRAGPPFFALLGEYGSGKTATLKAFTLHLLRKRQDDPTLPLPIYVDLRLYVGETPETVPTIEELLDQVLQRSGRVRERVSAQEVLRLVREEGAILLFDGLDEKLVHLSPERARAFIRTLWDVLPDAAKDGDSHPEERHRGKLLISCRTHAFRDPRGQTLLLAGAERKTSGSGRFPGLSLLPFNENQIRNHLFLFLGDAKRGAAAFEQISSILDLEELASRPYLLHLISGLLGEWEKFQTQGGEVDSARLYDFIVRAWLSRDEGKHQLAPDHKRRLMEDLAAALKLERTLWWNADRLEGWLDTYLENNPSLAEACVHKDRTVLQADLRTATFLVRPTPGTKYFRFAHPSLQDYFLASYLARALIEGRTERWAALPNLSWGTFAFLGEMLAVDPQQPTALRTLEAILGGETVSAARLAFRYWLVALEEGWPTPAPTRVKLAGANLAGWNIHGADPARPLSLAGADLSGARLHRARLDDVDLTEALLDGAQARQALFMNVTAPRASLREADLQGVKWHEGSLEDANLLGTRLHGGQWIRTKLAEARLPEDWEPRAAAVRDGPTPSPGPGVSLTLDLGHAEHVRTCAWSPDGRRLLSGSEDHSLKIWDAASGQCLLTLSGHAFAVLDCAWSPDSRRILSGSYDKTLKVWDASSGQCLLTLSGHDGAVKTCAWSPDGRYLLAGCAEKSLVDVLNGVEETTLKVWDASSGQCLLTLSGHKAAVVSCAWSPDGQRLLSGSDDFTLKVWDASSGRCLRTLSGHTYSVDDCAWSPDGQRLLSGSGDGTLKVWDASSGQCLRTLSGHDGGVGACAWSPDGQRLLSSGPEDGFLKIWDASSGECLRTLSGHSSYVDACAWSPDGRHLLSGSFDTSLRVWDASSGQCLLVLPGHADWLLACAWSPDGQRLLSGSLSGSLKVWDTCSGRCLLTLSEHESWVLACAWSPDGQRLLSGSLDESLKVWDASSGQCLLTLSGHTDKINTCAWSPDGRRVLSGSHDSSLKVWDATSGQCLLTLLGHKREVEGCAWSPDGLHLLSGGYDGVLRIWDASSGQCLRTLSGHNASIQGCAWSPDGRHLLSGGYDNNLKVWDASSGQCLLTLSGHGGPVFTCAWSPDGQRVLSGSLDKTLKVWDASSGECLRTLSGHSWWIIACAWSPDGRHLLSSAILDRALKVWDASTGQCSWSAYLLPLEETVSIDETTGRVLHASPEAWRWLAWRWTDPATGQLRLLPAEAFGPLPP